MSSRLTSVNVAKATNAAAARKLLLRARGIHKVYMSPEAPFARFMTAVRGTPATGKIHTVLRDIDLDVYKGETLGIMGRNGAGKSTLLGVLADVLPATAGTVERFGKVSVLLELGSGFDQNLTGRENARVYCSLMGMSSKAIEKALPLIERFADIGDYFDLPARTYSSGMYARTAFAAAIHVDADFIIVDETLSVGDASFRVKCYTEIERMQAAGKTFLMVSHNQNVIANFCSRAIVIENGRKIFDGAPIEAVSVYKRARIEAEAAAAALARVNMVGNDFDEIEEDEAALTNSVKLDELKLSTAKNANGLAIICVNARLTARRRIEAPVFNLIVRNANGALIGALETSDSVGSVGPIERGASVEVETHFRDVLAPGAHFLSVFIWENGPDGRVPVAYYENCSRFDVTRGAAVQGLVDLGFTWRRVDLASAADELDRLSLDSA
jgi:ABC-type polysaccharide/polyol phosphate transport system ATPase subunit